MEKFHIWLIDQHTYRCGNCGFLDISGDVYRAPDVDDLIGRMDSTYQDRLLDFEGKVYHAESKVAALEAELGWAKATIAALQEITCVSGDRRCEAARREG